MVHLRGHVRQRTALCESLVVVPNHLREPVIANLVGLRLLAVHDVLYLYVSVEETVLIHELESPYYLVKDLKSLRVFQTSPFRPDIL